MATASSQKRLLARLIIFALLIGVVLLVRHCQQASTQIPAPQSPSSTTQQPGAHPQNGTPKYVLDVLQYVRHNGQAPDGYVGGREFQNKEKKLPAKSNDGKRIRYSEWDVQRKVQGQNRGPERLVTGSDHSAWYTSNHYKTFEKIE